MTEEQDDGQKSLAASSSVLESELEFNQDGFIRASTYKRDAETEEVRRTQKK
jgi:hypothetical protein